jgi:iron complex transport system substrate-binding protein
MKRAYAHIALAALAALAVAACDTEKGKPAVEPTPPSRPTVLVTDSLGRQVRVPVPARRIACLYAFTGHVVAMLGRQQDVVAVSNGLKRDVLLNTFYPAFGRARVPKAQGALNVEELVNARPDLALISGDIGRREGERGKLERFEIPYLVIDFTSMDEQQQAIAAIGKAIGAEDRAIEYNRYTDEVLQRLAARTADLDKKKRVRLYQATTDPTRTVAAKSLPVQWMQRIGIESLAAGLPQGRENQVGIEQLFLWDPDVIVANEPGVAQAMRDNPQWATLKALREDRVYQMPIGISRWGHPGSLETPLAALWTARTVYPDRFADLDLRSETRDFYRRFFAHELSEEMVSRVLRGEDMRLGKDRKPLPRSRDVDIDRHRHRSRGRQGRGDGSGRRRRSEGERRQR